MVRLLVDKGAKVDALDKVSLCEQERASSQCTDDEVLLCLE